MKIERKMYRNRRVIHGKYIVLCNQIQENLISCDATENIDRAQGTSWKSKFEEKIYKTNNLDEALRKYMKDMGLENGKV